MTNKKKPVSDEDKALFRRAVAGTRPLNPKIAVSAQHRPKVNVKIHAPVLDEPTLNDRLINTLDAPIDGQTNLLFNRSGISARDLQTLKRGEFATHAVLDLHGQTVLEARASLIHFLHSCQQRQLRYARVIHGKGKTSSQGQAVLKNQVAHWLQQCDIVLAFCSAKSRHGGTGAVNILLKALSKVQT